MKNIVAIVKCDDYDTINVDALGGKAYNVLNGELPESGEDCDYCKWNQESNVFSIK